MKAFSCGAVVPGCTANFTTHTEEEMLTRVAQHAEHDHGMTTIPAELVAQVREHIHDTPGG